MPATNYTSHLNITQDGSKQLTKAVNGSIIN